MGHAKRSRAGVSLQYVVSPLFTLLPERPTNQLLVIYDENLFRRHCVSLAYYGRTEWERFRGSTFRVGSGPDNGNTSRGALSADGHGFCVTDSSLAELNASDVYIQ